MPVPYKIEWVMSDLMTNDIEYDRRLKTNTVIEGAGTEDNHLNVGDFYLDVAKGNVEGHSVIHKFGRNPSVSTVDFEPIWNGGGTYTGFNATVAETVTVTSSNADDTLLGTGLRTIRIYGLDANWLQQTEDVEMNGTTPVLSTKAFIRLDRARGLETGGGTFSSNLGEITIAQSITVANIFAVLPIGYGSTMIAAYTIPAGKKGYLLSRGAGLSNKQAAAVAVRLKAKVPGSVFTVQGEVALNSQGTGFIEKEFKIPPELPPMTDLFIEAVASASVAVSGLFSILLVDE